jgi:uncharacterized protein
MRWSRFPAWKLTVGYPRTLRKSVLTIVDMLYTWDEEKRKANRAKHGVDLADAALIFEDFCLIREDVTEGYAEQRFLAIGRAGGRLLMVVYTLPDEDTIRIISARRADRPERRRYFHEYAKQFR